MCRQTQTICMPAAQRTTPTVLKHDAFDSIHALLRQRKYGAVLRRIVDTKGGRLKAEYRTDSNHAWYIVGDILFRRGRFGSAALAFKRALRSRPNDAQASWALGNVYSELAKPTLAERYFRKALRHDKSNDAVRFNLGNALFDQQKYELAIDVYRTVKRSSRREFRLARKNIDRAKARLANSSR